MMDRNREARRAAAASMAAGPNGLSRRRHRSSSLRDSPDEDASELQEPARLRDRGIKKDRDRERDREHRDRERERLSRSSKRRRAERMMNAGDESSEEDESVNDEDDDDDADVAGGAFSRMLPPLPNPALSSAPPSSILTSQNHSHNHHSHHQHRKSFPSATKVFKAAPAAPAWKATDEMIGFSVPRKARSASTKRSHDWIGVGGGAEQMIHRQASTSPVRQGLVSSTPSPAAVRDAAPLSPPSSSNATVRKKIKPNGGTKPRPPPKSSMTSKSSNSNPEELEIEIAEVLYGLMTQSQAPKNESTSKLELNNNKSNGDAKSRVSSPVSNSSTAIPPQNSSSSAAAQFTVTAPKRKRPRQVTENNFSGRSSPMKVEIDQPKTEISSPNLERNSGSGAENGDLANLVNSVAEANNRPQESLKFEDSTVLESKGPVTEEAWEREDMVLPAKVEVNSLKESTAVRLDDKREDTTVTLIVTPATRGVAEVSDVESKREDKFQIDLMAPPPQLRASPEREGLGGEKRMVFDTEKKGELLKDKEEGKVVEDETVIKSDDKRAKAIIDERINKERDIDLQFDLEKPDRDGINKSPVPKLQLQSSKGTLREEPPPTDKTVQPSSLTLPMSVASWPGGLSPPMGYMAPLQGVVSMDGSALSSAPIQPLFSQPRPKRCATHCHIARNIHYYQQLMKMNPFWPAAAAGSASIFGAKPGNLNVMPSVELNGSVAGRSVNLVQDKGQGLSIFPGHAGKDKVPQAASNIPDAAHRKQQIMLQQALPPVPPNNMMHAPAFIFPFNQQQAVAAAASVRPGSAKSPATTGGLVTSGAPPSSSTLSSSSTTPASANALSFNYPNMSGNETQYLVLQNNPYQFPIPAVGAPPNFRGTHGQPMPMFNGPFYSSQMIHPSQLQQQQPPPSQSQQMQHPHPNTSSGSSSSQKHLHNQQPRPQGNAINGGTGSGNMHNFPIPKNRSSQQPQQQHMNQHIAPPQARQLEGDAGGEDSPSTADSRVSRATMNIYGQNFAMPIHPQNFALMTSPASLAGATAASGNQNDKKQQQQGFKSGGGESLPPQPFAMSFGPINGSTTASGIDISSMAQNQAILQSLPEATRQSYHHHIMQAAAAAQVAQQKNSRISEDGKTGGGGDSSNADEERKVISGKIPATAGGQSIAFSRSDFTDASGSSLPGNSSVVDNSSRSLNLASGPTRTTRSSIPNVMGTVGGPSSHLQAQFQHHHHQQQQMIQMHKQQHQQQQQLAAAAAARSNKAPVTSNGTAAYSEHLTSSSSIAAKFPNALSGFQQNFVQPSSNASSAAQSSQWKNSTRTSTGQVQASLASSTSSSLKNHTRAQQQSHHHTQISFGANQKPSVSSQGQGQGQQQPPPNSSSQSPSPPILVSSPTHSSISKGGGAASGSPRTTPTPSTNNKTSGQASTLSSSSQQGKNNSPSISNQKSSPVSGRNVPSILGNNPHISSSAGTKTQQQQQYSKQSLQQAQAAQIFFSSNPYLQAQAQVQPPPQSTSSNAAAATSSGGFYLQRRRNEPQQQPQGGSSSGMLSLCTPVTLSNTTTTDPAKAVAAAAAAAAASNIKGGGLSSSQQSSILHSAQFASQSSGNSHQLLQAGFSYVPNIPSATVQVKPAAEQKQPAGNDNLHACWQQPEKK